MSKILKLNGIIRNVNYDPQVRTKPLERVAFDDFDINSAPASGIIEFADNTSFGYSKWKSPKPSRTYPSASIYKTYHLQSKRVTVIPVLKDEGKDTPNNDRISSMTLARMNLMGVYIILAWYERAEPHPKGGNKTADHFYNNKFVLERIREIKRAQKSALHWNMMHFKRDFEYVYRQAVESYQNVGKRYSLEMHSAEKHLAILEQYLVDGKFNLEAFARYSSARSSAAAKRESMTAHDLEELLDGDKAYLELENIQGGIYHLTADEVYWEEGRLVIQESKNTTKGKLPSLGDVQDGLFKNILFYSIDELYIGAEPIEFVTRIKLTGNINGRLRLPAEVALIEEFASENKLTPTARRNLLLYNSETIEHAGLSIEIATNK